MNTAEPARKHSRKLCLHEG